MIKFFRKIRQKLLSKNKFSKYLVYAIGEIILVVIGILIALQINNWNENRKKNKEEQHYLNDLKTEFSRNLMTLEHLIKNSDFYFENALKLANYTLTDSLNLSEPELNYLLFNSIIPEVQYRPAPGTLNEILNSGKLEIITNSELRSKLSSWNGILLKVRFQEEEHAYTRLKILDMIYTQGEFRNGYIDTNFKKFGLMPRNTESSNIQLLNKQEFDNLISVFYLTGKYLNENYYGELKLNIAEIIDLIDKG
ncbi:DUF6090 family protein [Aestuariivivens marinum]|uniref:DUF6090 family protein n=1 Tax=Aestuariivivens marinum TaxID=2913555 RepID=UPI001F580717|nr:DUF6090 family protein [Aestuariivivens marinum]